MGNKSLHRIFVLLVLFFGMSVIMSCAQFTLINANKDIPVGRSIIVNSPVVWSKGITLGVETWTIDGPNLQRLMFFNGITEGKPLFKVNMGKDQALPVFKSTMNVLEIVEFIEASLKRIGSHNVTTKALRPENFDKREGFRFELSFTTESGLNYNGIFKGAIHNHVLVAIMYVGTEMYYFGKNLDDVEKIIASARIM